MRSNEQTLGEANHEAGNGTEAMVYCMVKYAAKARWEDLLAGLTRHYPFEKMPSRSQIPRSLRSVIGAAIGFAVAASMPVQAAAPLQASFVSSAPVRISLLDFEFEVERNVGKQSLDGVSTCTQSVADVRSRSEFFSLIEANRAQLIQLTEIVLQDCVKSGDRLGMMQLARLHIEEAAKLVFAPIAANDALSDAIRLYSFAATRGYPGVVSVDRNTAGGLMVRALRE